MSDTELKMSDILALDRTRMASERTLMACIQHWKYMKNLGLDQPYKPWDLTFVVACLIALARPPDVREHSPQGRTPRLIV